MDFCDCMITEHMTRPPTCNQCYLELDQCECKNLRHSYLCPDHPDKKKKNKVKHG